MKINSDASLKTASAVFKEYNFSWAAVRQAARRGDDGVLVVPVSPAAADEAALPAADANAADLG